MSNYNSPHHRFDTLTGWRVFASEPDTETIYGDYRLKWTVIDEEGRQRSYTHSYARTKFHLSVDGGQTWLEENSVCWLEENGVWSLYSTNHSLVGNYHENCSDFNKALLAAREEWRLARRKRLDRGRRENFNSLPPEQRAVVKAERAEAWKLRKEQAAERKAQKTARIMSQMLEIGPELVRLKEDIENAIRLMAKGGVDRAFPYYYSRRRYLSTAKWAVNDIRRHIENAQKRAEEKNS
jgi:hypothetical protein